MEPTTPEDREATIEALIEAACRRPIPQTLDEISPRSLPPPGKTTMQMVHGQWPGDETTEELLAQLARLDENDPDVENIRLEDLRPSVLPDAGTDLP